MQAFTEQVRSNPSNWQTSFLRWSPLDWIVASHACKTSFPLGRGQLEDARMALIHVSSILGCCGRSNGALSRTLPSSEGAPKRKLTLLFWGMDTGRAHAILKRLGSLGY